MRHLGDNLSEQRIAVDGIFPDLIGEGGEVDFAVFRVVEDAGFFGEEVADDLVVLIVFEEGFVSADDFGVFLEALANALAKADDTIDAVGREE